MIKNPKTKIVCTLGPSTESEQMIQSLVESGMNIARLNLSHGSIKDHAVIVQRIRKIAGLLDEPISVMVDVPGTKYRTGPLVDGFLIISPGDHITLTSRDIIGTQDLVGVAPSGIHRDATQGATLLLDDGFMKLLVTEIRNEDVLCEVIIGGKLTERRGVTTLGRSPTQPFPDSSTVTALEFAAEQDADFVALSTVTSADHVTLARAILGELGSDAIIISKIERPEALTNFDSILAASDAIMVARGDMGVEVGLSEVPVIQKDLISRCNAAGKPVITATQMLESMVKSPVPTRAEVADVANAIYDGTDAVMLSGETSIGKYPNEAVLLMSEVATKTESALPYKRMIVEKRNQLESNTDDAIAYDACQTADQLDASLILAFTESGSTAGRVSKYRPKAPILALTPNDKVQRRLTLRWGVTPEVVTGIETVDDFFVIGEEQAVKAGLKPGSLSVLVAGLPIGVAGATNLLRVLTMPDGLDNNV